MGRINNWHSFVHDPVQLCFSTPNTPHSISKMFASAGGKQRRVSSHSDDLRRLALHNSYLQRRMAELSHTKDSSKEPDISRSSVRPLRPVIDDRSIARSPSATSTAYTYVLALRRLGRRTTTSLDSPLLHSRQASRDHQHLSSTQHNKVRMYVGVSRSSV